MPQTTFDQYPSIAVQGLIADSGYRNINSNANSGGNVAFGNVVVYSDADGVNVEVPPTATEVVAGIAIAKQKEQSRTVINEAIYANEESISVMTKGRAWVLLDSNSTAVSVGDAVYSVSAATVPADAGNITGVSTDNLEISSTRFMTSGVAGDLVVVEINLP